MSKLLDKTIAQHVTANETVVAVLRGYSIADSPRYGLLLFVYFGWLFLMTWWFTFGVVGITIFTVGLVSLVGYTVRSFIIWNLDVMILTTQRLIDIARTGLFAKQVQIVLWPEVQAVSYAQTGMMATVFHYGTITVTTNRGAIITVQHIYQPQIIRELMAQYVAH